MSLKKPAPEKPKEKAEKAEKAGQEEKPKPKAKENIAEDRKPVKDPKPMDDEEPLGDDDKNNEEAEEALRVLNEKRNVVAFFCKNCTTFFLYDNGFNKTKHSFHH